MDGFRVVRLEDILSHLDILISATGKWNTSQSCNAQGGGGDPAWMFEDTYLSSTYSIKSGLYSALFVIA